MIGDVKFVLQELLLTSGMNPIKPASAVNIGDREAAWRLMATNPWPLVRAFGKLDQLSGGHALTVKSASESYRFYLEDCLKDATQSAKTESRLQYYKAVNYLANADLVKFCNFMLQQHDLQPDILGRTTSYLLSQTSRESAGEAIELYDRAIALLKQPNVRFFGGETNQCLLELSKQRAIAQKKFDGITEPPAPPLPPAWREARQLVDLAGAKNGLAQIFRPVIQGDYVYAAGYGMNEADGGQFLQLLRIPLKGGTVEPVSQIAVTNVGAVAACVDENNYYLGTSQGVYIFPKPGGKVQHIDQNDGLPSDQVTALDCLNGKLYVGLGESGYLVSYDWQKHQCEVLCSPRRREQLSPFDNGSPMGISIIVADESKHQIVFLADQGGGGGDWWSDLGLAQQTKTDVFQMMCAKARAGIWSYNPATSEFKCILPRHPNAQISDVRQVRRISETEIAMVADGGAALFNFITDKAELLYGKCYTIGLEAGMENMVLGRGMKVDSALHYAPLLDRSPGDLRSGVFFVHDGWVWNAGRTGDINFSRVAMDTGRKQDLAPLRVDDKNFIPADCFQLVGLHQALVGDQRGLWLVSLATDEGKAQTAPH